MVGTSFLIDSILQAGNQEKVFTPLIGKGVKFFVKNKPADQLLLDINKNVKSLEDTKKKMHEVSDILDKAEKTLQGSKDFSKKDLEDIKSTINEVKNMEQAKLTDFAKDLAKKIKEYSEKNKK